MNELQKIEERVKREVALKLYKGNDRVVLASDKKKELDELSLFRPKFSVDMGFAELTDCIKHLGLGRLVVVSGPPKNGKTQLCQTLTKRFEEQGHKQLWFSYEVGYEELFSKFPMTNLNFYLPNYLETGNIDWIEDKIIESKQKFGTQVVYIDNLDFLRDTRDLRNVGINMASYVGGIVQRIKRIAVEQDILIFLMAHIAKTNWTSNKLPEAQDIRDSGQVAQLADVVMMITRYRKNGLYQGTDASVGIIENRLNGVTKVTQVELKGGEFCDKDTLKGVTVYAQEKPTNPDEKWNDGANFPI